MDTGKEIILDVRDLHVAIRLKNGNVLHAVRDLSLSVDRGETIAIVGESGSGKSITAAAVTRLLPRRATMTAGRMEFTGRDLTTMSERAMTDLRGAGIGMVFQDPVNALNPAYPIGNQLIETYRRHRQATHAKARMRAIEMLERVGLTAAGDRLDQYPHQLSGGICQRVMIAMALICEPAMLIADEPTTALDVTTQAQILALLAELRRDLDMALVLISHDLGVVSRLAERIYIMYAGQVVEHGDCASVLNRPSHPYTRALLDCVPAPGRRRLGAIPGIARSVIGQFQGCAFRDRCSHATNACEGDIPVRDVGPNHQSRCVLNPRELNPARQVAS